MFIDMRSKSINPNSCLFSEVYESRVIKMNWGRPAGILFYTPPARPFQDGPINNSETDNKFTKR